ncbi:MAG TPA: hypothetical protein VKS01_03345 [Bryobacteraceae bacterium]|nr:hypothetical protein [Bryobacteraceae bacterium]
MAQQLADRLTQTIRDRILAGENVDDQAAPALSTKGRQGGYSARKTRRGEPAVRDWKLTGRTLSSLGPTSVTANEIRIGFTDARAAKIAAINNGRDRMWGIGAQSR